MSNLTAPTALLGLNWRDDALRIIDALFPVTSVDAWDDLLDLRCELIAGDQWGKVLDLFLVCRDRLELDHYLPFFRLRRLLSNSLQLEAGLNSQSASNPDLACLLARQPRCLADIQRSIQRDWFEHDLDLGDPESIQVQVVERAF